MRRLLALALFLACAVPVGAARDPLVVNDRQPIQATAPRPKISGVADALEGTEVEVKIEGSDYTASHRTTVDARRAWRLEWPEDLERGLYDVTVRAVIDDEERTATAPLLVEPGGRLPRRPLVTLPYAAAPPAAGPQPDEFLPTTDRWRIPIPGTELHRFDPYRRNKWKGDVPIRGEDIFLVLTGASDTLVDAHEVPVPASVSTDRPGSIDFFGEGDVVLGQQNLLVSADLYKGATAFKPFEWRVRGTVAVNGNHLEVRENAVVSPDVRRGTDRTDGRLALQELFFELKLKDLSPDYDFLSVRLGIQPFSSDFRGFIFTDTNLGVRLFGNLAANRYQYNLAYFERLEKGTNSGLNTFELRDQRVVVANFYHQDFLVRGYTASWSLHYLQDDATFLIDRNGFLARPDPVGAATPHEIEALYLGWTGFGHVGRWNLDHALYYAIGEDSLNPIAGREILGMREDVDIGALMAAFEISIDRDWYRPKLAFFYASGDDDPTDRDARGFAAIFENPNFAGGGFSFWNRLGIRLAGTGASLVNRGSILPDLRTSKEEGQPNFVNPGIFIASAGLDVEVTPELRTVFHANYLRFDSSEVLEFLTFQGDVDEEIGLDLSAGFRYRPFLNNNFVILGGVSALLPGQGFEDIYEEDGALFGAFANVVLTF